MLIASQSNDEQSLLFPSLFPKWSGEAVSYLQGDRVVFEDKLYKCLTAHESQALWAPLSAPSLWVRIDNPAVEWPDWVQPAGGTDAYHTGDKVAHNDTFWISNCDNNVWEPGVYGWQEEVL